MNSRFIRAFVLMRMRDSCPVLVAFGRASPRVDAMIVGEVGE